MVHQDLPEDPTHSIPRKSKPTPACLSPPAWPPLPSTMGDISCLSTFAQKSEVHNLRLHACKWCKMKTTGWPLQYPSQTMPSMLDCLWAHPNVSSQHKTTHFFLYPLPISSKRKHYFWNKAKQKWLPLRSLLEQMTRAVKWEELSFTQLPPLSWPYWNELSCMKQRQDWGQKQSWGLFLVPQMILAKRPALRLYSKAHSKPG